MVTAIGQAKCAMKTRASNYCGIIELPDVAQRINDTGHNINISNYEIIRSVNLRRELDIY